MTRSDTQSYDTPISQSRDPTGQPLYSYDEIVSLYPLRWSRDLVNKMYTALLSFLKGLKSASSNKEEGARALRKRMIGSRVYSARVPLLLAFVKHIVRRAQPRNESVFRCGDTTYTYVLLF